MRASTAIASHVTPQADFRKPETDASRRKAPDDTGSVGRGRVQPLQSGFDDQHFGVERLERLAQIKRAERDLSLFMKLLPEPAPVIAELFERFAIFETDITVHDHLHCFRHDSIPENENPPAHKCQRVQYSLHPRYAQQGPREPVDYS
jgi:hypothetical protein